jgi:hypothetical protein
MLSVNAAAAETLVEVMIEFYVIADRRPFDASKLVPFFADELTNYDSQPGAPKAPGASMAGFNATLTSGVTEPRHVIVYIEPVGDNKALVCWQLNSS